MCVRIKFRYKESTFCYCSRLCPPFFYAILDAMHTSCKKFPDFCICFSGPQDANTREFNSLDIRHLNINLNIWDIYDMIWDWLSSLEHDSCKLFLPFSLGWVVLSPGSSCFSPLAVRLEWTSWVVWTLLAISNLLPFSSAASLPGHCLDQCLGLLGNLSFFPPPSRL